MQRQEQLANEERRQNLEREKQLAIKAQNEAEQQRFNNTVSELEARYPVINPDSPQYNQQVVDEVLTRMGGYVNQGIERASALKLAISDMERGR